MKGDSSNTALILQARTGSSRLPNKVILPFYNNSGILENLLLRILEQFEPDCIIVATTHSQADDAIVELCERLQVLYFRGDEQNVLSRFIQAAKSYNKSKIIRICADNPLLDMQTLETLFNYSKSSFSEDYVSYSFHKKPVILSHLGLFTELVSLKVLEFIHKLTDEKLYREHVTKYIYENPDMFIIKLIPIDSQIGNYEDIRLTVDTSVDFQLVSKVYSGVLQDSGQINTPAIIKYLNNNQSLFKQMRKEINRNEKI